MNASQCSIFHDLSHSLAYHIITSVKAILCTIGAVRLALQWKQYGVRFLVHENTKISFRFYLALNLFTSALLGSVHFFELIRLRFECFLLDFRLILLTRGFAICSIHAAQLVILLISFERLYSALFPGHFENHSSKFLSFSLAFTAIVGTFIYTMMKLSDNFRLFSDQKIEVAHVNPNIPENRKGFKDLAVVMVASNTLSLIVLCVDFYVNFRLQPGNMVSSLGVAYQRSENRRIVFALIPMELTQSFMGFFTAFSLFIYVKLISNPTPIEKQLFHELVTITVYFPLILTFFIKHNLKKTYSRALVIIPEVDHFEELRKSWE